MTVILGIHNLVRWLILAAAVFVLYRMIRGLIVKPAWVRTDRLAGFLFTIAMDVQLLLGMVLYLTYSPLIKTFFADIPTGMHNSVLRYWGIEHIGLMVVSVVLAHLAGGIAKKELSDQEKFRRSAIFFTITILILVASIPWSRPLLPNF